MKNSSKTVILYALFSSLTVTCVHANPILWSEATIYYDTISFTTTESLNVGFQDSAPQGTLTSRDEVFYNDIVPINGWGGYEYGTKDPDNWSTSWTTVQQTWDLTSTGSGTLEVSFDFTWIFTALPGYEPDAIYGGPDNILLDAYVNDTNVGHFQLNSYMTESITETIWSWSMPNVYFDEDQISSLTIITRTNANGLWLEKPKAPAPVPEPATILLFGTGLAGLAGVRQRKKRTSE